MQRLILDAQGLLIDLDGTLMHSRDMMPGARDFLALHGDKSIILSNNSSETAETLSSQLFDLGVEFPASRIVLAGAETVAAVAEQLPGGKVLIKGSRAIVAAAESAGLVINNTNPDIVIIARDETFDYAGLAEAANAISRGAFFVVTNPDDIHPGAYNWRVPETGALAAAVIAASGKKPDLVVGKPHPRIYLKALALLGLSAADVLMIGDNPDTDGRGANELDIPFCLVSDDMPMQHLIGI
jgi:HAD superfamily hydrolase (TIGR01450 family)